MWRQRLVQRTGTSRFLPAMNAPIDPAWRDSYFPAASNSFTFPITAKASAT